MEPRVFESEHFFVYSTEKPISAAMLADSLIGLDGVVTHSARLLAGMFEARVKPDGIYIKKIEFGSYEDNFVVRLIFGKGKTMERNIEKLRSKLNLEKMDTKKFIGWAIVVVICFGAYLYATQRRDEKAQITITNSFNTYGREVGLTGPELLEKVSLLVTNKDDLQKKVSKLTKPKGSRDNGSIVIDGDDKLSIPADVVAVVPPDFEAEAPEEPAKDFPKTQIVIRAADLDRQVGWFGIAPEISNSRVPVQLEEAVDRNSILLGKYNDAAITVLYKVSKSGEKTPKLYIVRQIFPAATGK